MFFDLHQNRLCLLRFCKITLKKLLWHFLYKKNCIIPKKLMWNDYFICVMKSFIHDVLFCTSIFLLFYGRLLHAAAYPSTSFPLQFTALLLVKVGWKQWFYHFNDLLNEMSYKRYLYHRLQGRLVTVSGNGNRHFKRTEMHLNDNNN